MRKIIQRIVSAFHLNDITVLGPTSRLIKNPSPSFNHSTFHSELEPRSRGVSSLRRGHAHLHMPCHPCAGAMLTCTCQHTFTFQAFRKALHKCGLQFKTCSTYCRVAFVSWSLQWIIKLLVKVRPLPSDGAHRSDSNRHGSGLVALAAANASFDSLRRAQPATLLLANGLKSF